MLGELLPPDAQHASGSTGEDSECSEDENEMAHLVQNIRRQKASDAEAAEAELANHGLNSNIPSEELASALELTPNYKAAGADGIKGEFLRYLGEEAREVLLRYYNLIFDHHKSPAQWRKDVAWPIHKQGSEYDPGNYRLITLMSTMAKVYERVMHARLTKWCNSQRHHPISPQQVGFQSNLCTLDHLYTLAETVRIRGAAKKPTYARFVDARKAFPSVFKAGLLVKLHHLGVRGRYWLMVSDMYASIKTRILTGHDEGASPADLEALYYDIHTGVREGSILSPLLYILFIDGLLDELSKSNLGVQLRNRLTGELTWVGALMYADDLLLLADGPGELQLMMSILTKYARKWRFEINPKRTKTAVLCFLETKTQERQRKDTWGATWRCGGHVIHERDSYVYLGVQFTTDLNFHPHISQLKHLVATQKREAVLLGARSGVLPMRRAIFLWKQWVEPKYAYACALWAHPDDDSAMSLINRIQREGAQTLLGVTSIHGDVLSGDLRETHCPLLREAHLLPAHALHAAGLMRFMRLIRSRPADSLLKRVWLCIESYRPAKPVGLWRRSINVALHRLRESHPGLHPQCRLPPTDDRLEWKRLTNRIAHAETEAWTNDHIRRGGRVAAYADIASELRPVNRELPPYLTCGGLNQSERRIIAQFRLHCTNYLATHAGHRKSALYGQPRPYQQRCCIWPHCAQRGLLDDVPHVLFNCPLHQAERTPFLAGVNTRLIGLGLRLSDMAPPASQVSFLLGSVPPPMAQHAGGVEHRDILRDVARYLATVRYHRWVCRPRQRPPA